MTSAPALSAWRVWLGWRSPAQTLRSAHQAPRGSCRGNPCVATRSHDDASLWNRVGQQAVKHAASLEAACGLKMLQLEPYLGAGNTQGLTRQLLECIFKNKVAVALMKSAQTAINFIATSHRKRPRLSGCLMKPAVAHLQRMPERIELQALGQRKLNGFFNALHLAHRNRAQRLDAINHLPHQNLWR
ncbi:MAG: hypothetical protein JWP47_1192 [Polaromonas sp.]|nr:hypothetical protein [Polaromonas sp.]